MSYFLSLKSGVLKNKYKCTECGKSVYAFNLASKPMLVKLMLSNKICWDCAYWSLFLDALPDHLEVIDGKCYQVFPYVKKKNINQVLGGKGKTKYILKTDGECIRSNDVWWLNTIPERYRDGLPDTGYWTTDKIFRGLNYFDNKCNARGCLDRYFCYRYQRQIEKKNGAYNVVPKNWVEGSERCPSFLPISQIQGYVVKD